MSDDDDFDKEKREYLRRNDWFMISTPEHPQLFLHKNCLNLVRLELAVRIQEMRDREKLKAGLPLHKRILNWLKSTTL